MSRKTTANFLISLLLTGIYFSAGYYYFECHSVFDLFMHRKWLLYSIWFSLGVGGISFLLALITQKVWNSLPYLVSWLMNMVFSAAVIYSYLEYDNFYDRLFLRGKILWYCIVLLSLFILQTIFFFVLRAKAAKKQVQ